MSDTVNIRLSAQRALLGAVPASLRAFSVSVNSNAIHARSVFDETATEEDKELLSVAGAEIVADYPEPFTITEEFLVVPSCQKIQHLEVLIFLRHEPQQGAAPDRFAAASRQQNGG